MKKVLTLIVSQKWFDLIWEGKKVFDYREIKPYWTTRLMNKEQVDKEYDEVHVCLAYDTKRPCMIFKWKGYHITREDEETDLGVGQFYAIDLSEYISSENINEGLSGYQTAEEEYECCAMTFIENIPLSEMDLSYHEKKLLVLLNKRPKRGTILCGEPYIKSRSINYCGEGERFIYRAIPMAHEFNISIDMYAC